MKFYHISPENFNRFSPKYSSIFKCKGVFVSPTFKSIIFDWAMYVFYKKDRKNVFRKKHYSHLYIYTILLDKETIEEIKYFYDFVFHSDEWSTNKIYGFWFWGEQLFIPEDLISRIRIIKKKKYSYTEIDRLYKRLRNLKWEYNIITEVERNKNDQISK